MMKQGTGYLLIIGMVALVVTSCNLKYGNQPVQLLTAEDTHPEAVIAVIDKELELQPDNPALLKRKVSFYESSGWPAGSYPTLVRAIEVAPDDGELRYQLGRYHFSRDELVEAKRSLIQAGELGYLTANYFLTFAQVLLKSGDPDGAFSQMRRFQKLDPGNYRSHHLMGKIYQEQGDTLRALESLELALSLEQGNDELNLQLIDLYLGRQDTANYNRVIDRISRQEVAWLVKLALLQQSHGLTDQAIRNFKEIITIDTTFLPARAYLIDTYYRAENYDSALYHSSALIGLDSLHLQARLVKARSHDKKYQYQQSIEAYETLVGIDSTYGNASEELIAVYRKVAYLRRLREEKESIPEFNFAPIKKREVNNNNK